MSKKKRKPTQTKQRIKKKFVNTFLLLQKQMQGAFEANCKTVVHVLCCKCDHIVFPNGIAVNTLYKNHNGIFLSKHQQMKWSDNEHYEVCVPSHRFQVVAIEKQTKKEFPAHSFYKLTEEQTKLMKVKCPTCFPFVKK